MGDGPRESERAEEEEEGGQREVTWGWEEDERVRADESREGSLRRDGWWSMGQMRGE